MTLFAFHGFLGSAGDWNFLPAALPSVDAVVPVDLPGSLPVAPMKDWAAAFNISLRAMKDPLGSNLLIGYSLGGRLALHLLLDDPALWKGAVIVSAHPGLDNAEERKKRAGADELWAKRIEEQPWKKWIGDWNAQPVFRNDLPMGTAPLTRKRCGEMAEMLRCWSLGRQTDLAEGLQSIDIPILWVVGEKDDTFVKQAQRLRFSNPSSGVAVIEGAGHRVPWGAQRAFLESITQFMSHLKERQ